MSEPLVHRIAASMALSELDPDAILDAVIHNREDFLTATSRFTPPEGPLDPGELRAAADATTEAIAAIEARLETIVAELARTHRPSTPATETGRNIDCKG